MKPESSKPKTTRPSARMQREKPAEKKTARRIQTKLDAFPDKIDIRDWIYQPTLQSLPDQLINCELVPGILDQGNEGACTGFALAANINYHLAVNGRCNPRDILKIGASPRMLYEMARRYDEWPGERYEGSSARGTMKGWTYHGVTMRNTWKDNMIGVKNFDEAKAKNQVIKLVARALKQGNEYQLTVRPEFLDQTHPLANVSGGYMAVLYESDINGQIFARIMEENPYPTAAGVLRDVINLYQ